MFKRKDFIRYKDCYIKIDDIVGCAVNEIDKNDHTKTEYVIITKYRVFTCKSDVYYGFVDKLKKFSI